MTQLVEMNEFYMKQTVCTCLIYIDKQNQLAACSSGLEGLLDWIVLFKWLFD